MVTALIIRPATTVVKCQRFHVVPPQTIIMPTTLHAVHDDDDADNDNNTGDALFLERFRRRRDILSKSNMQSMQLKQRQQTNINREDDPIQLAVTTILDSLSRPHYPVPYFGYKILYEGSTPHWKEVLRKSVGASMDTDETFFFTALRASMERPYNQFGILVGLVEDNDEQTQNFLTDDDAYIDNGHVGCQYKLEFPRDTLDYYDGTAWVECRLRDVHSDALLVVLGWSMKQQEEDSSSSAWLVDGIDWQDFRERYRPGIGREEWERICG